MSSLNGNSARSLLDAAYTDLHFAEGDLLPAEDHSSSYSTEQWMSKGDWLTLAKQVGAEKVFFVNNNPLVVFAKSNGSDLATLRMFNRIWCMSRPMFVFIARDGELSVHKLARPPVRTLSEWSGSGLDVAQETGQVASRLNKYRREQLESGRLFEDSRFGTFDERADRLLINDLKTVREALQDAGLDKTYLKYAHSLIGRSIFIRYLEDREILKRSYFDEVAEGNADWQALLEVPLEKPDVNPEMEGRIYPRVLSNHAFTYALFDKLAKDFNGDMFPSDPRERTVVSQHHLSLLQGFLRGDVQAAQQNLFFWAYRFDIIPVELISNIYEEFYHKEKGESDQKGTHYTPGTLVDFLVSQVLTEEVLQCNPRIMDVACGSGIFLVEAFRRLVRFYTHRQNGERLTAKELRDVLRYQIAGMEIEEEAIRVAAFSLYLALLHYQEPKDISEQIAQGMRLPNLLFSQNHKTDDFHFNNLLCINAFKASKSASDDTTPPDETRFGSFLDEPPDVIVGNPPWGKIDKKEKSFVKKWCGLRKYPVGHDEYSQAFVWKALELLREGGIAALLLSSGVLFKHQKNSQEFRRKWLSKCKVLEVINFAHVRDVFFRRGTAPFISAIFQKATETPVNPNHVVRYWSAKKLAHADRWQAVVLTKPDLRLILQYDLKTQDRLWKIYWWGNDHDRALVEWLEHSVPLAALSDDLGERLSEDLVGRGFQENQDPKEKDPAPPWFKEFRELPTKSFNRYGPLSQDDLVDAPDLVERTGKMELYTGERLLIKRGISQGAEAKGMIVARVESIPFSFRNSIHGLKLRDGKSWEYKTLLAIFWSSLARYYYFLTSSAWGLWHFELHSAEIARMPIRLPEEPTLRDRIVDAVTDLQSWRPSEILPGLQPDIRAGSYDPELRRMETQLDEAIFDLYELSQPERELIRDLCETGLDFLYDDYHSRSAEPVSNVERSRGSYQGIVRKSSGDILDDYLKVFVKRWKHESDVKLNWSVIQPGGNWPMTAVIFSNQEQPRTHDSESLQEDSWFNVLEGLSEDLLVPYNSPALYIDGMVRVVTDSQIIIVKRSDKRLWTGSMAREDAEATLVRLMAAQEEGNYIETPTKPHRRQSLA